MQWKVSTLTGEYAKVLLVSKTHYTLGWSVSLISTAVWQQFCFFSLTSTAIWQETHSGQQRAAVQSPQEDPCQWIIMIQVSKVRCSDHCPILPRCCISPWLCLWGWRWRCREERRWGDNTEFQTAPDPRRSGKSGRGSRNLHTDLKMS